MARTARLVLINVVHHVVARGVDGCRLFANGFEKAQYLKRFAAVAEELGVLVHGYCLMDNHVHFLLTPPTLTALAQLMQRAHTSWALRVNRKYRRTGHLFQGRYHSSPLAEDHFWTALRYVEVNPRRAGRVKQQLEEFAFCSARAHLTGEADPLVALVAAQTRRRYTREEWREFLEQADPDREQDLRRAQAGSRPWGDGAWVRGLEQRFHRKLAWSPPGRPRKQPAQAVAPA